MKRLMIMAALALAGCASKADQAADDFDRTRNSGASDTQLCRSATAVVDAYRAEGDTAKVEQWAVYADSFCAGAAISEGYRR